MILDDGISLSDPTFCHPGTFQFLCYITPSDNKQNKCSLIIK